MHYISIKVEERNWSQTSENFLCTLHKLSVRGNLTREDIGAQILGAGAPHQLDFLHMHPPFLIQALHLGDIPKLLQEFIMCLWFTWKRWLKLVLGARCLAACYVPGSVSEMFAQAALQKTARQVINFNWINWQRLLAEALVLVREMGLALRRCRPGSLRLFTYFHSLTVYLTFMFHSPRCKCCVAACWLQKWRRPAMNARRTNSAWNSIQNVGVSIEKSRYHVVVNNFILCWREQLWSEEPWPIRGLRRSRPRSNLLIDFLGSCTCWSRWRKALTQGLS